ncbi:MAG: hypothetical protein PHH98_01800 [Candidatus Gracilibacteria bacterium]|nr:hypothetical protein [Candidatus Gracilibacteria bacterium]
MKGINTTYTEKSNTESILRTFGVDTKDKVDYYLTKQSSNNANIELTWSEIIKNAMNYDNDAISFIKMNESIYHKFFIFFTSELNLEKISNELREKIVKSILDDNIDEVELRKILNESCSNPECKLPENIENINNNGPVKLKDLSLYMLGNYTSIPRSVEISDGRFVTIVKTSSTNDGKQIYTIRYGIKNPYVAYPVYKGISSFIIQGNNINFLDLICSNEKNNFLNDLNDIKEFLLLTFKVNKELLLNEIKKGKTSNVLDKIIDGINKFKFGFFKSKLYDAGENISGHKVIFVQTNYTDDKLFSQLEMNLFNENGKNIIYIGALSKDSVKIRFVNSVPGLLSRLRDIYKKFDNNGKIEIWSFIANKDGVTGVLRKDSLGIAINRYKQKTKKYETGSIHNG